MGGWFKPKRSWSSNAACGAALWVTPETIISVCNYCGYPMAVPSFVSLEKMYVVPSKPWNAAVFPPAPT